MRVSDQNPEPTKQNQFNSLRKTNVAPQVTTGIPKIWAMVLQVRSQRHISSLLPFPSQEGASHILQKSPRSIRPYRMEGTSGRDLHFQAAGYQREGAVDRDGMQENFKNRLEWSIMEGKVQVVFLLSTMLDFRGKERWEK